MATGVIGWAMQSITCPMCRDRGERVMHQGWSIAQASRVYDVGTIGRVVDSLIGHNVKFQRIDSKPTAYKVMLGDNSEVGVF